MPRVQCPKCKTRLELDATWAGKQGKCPNCRSVLSIPGPAPVSPMPPKPPEVGAPQVQAQPADKPALRPRPWLVLGIVVAAILLLFLAVLLAGRRKPDPDPDVPVAGASGEGKHSGGGVSGEPGVREGGPNATVPTRPDVPKPADGGTRQVPPEQAFGPSGASAVDVPGPDEGPPSSRPEEGLVGVSRQYDDLACQQIQSRHGIRIPRGAAVIEIDGLRLPIIEPAALAAAPAPILLLPRGTHALLFRANESAVPVTIQSDFVSEYRAMREFFGVGGSIRGGELMSRSARAMDVHGSPFLLNLMGASHAAADRWGVAERTFRRALAVNPTFSPAHLNLAECLFRRNALEEAAREAELAAIFNVQNVYGVAAGVSQMRRKLGLPIAEAGPVDAREMRYVGSAPLSEEDERMTALLEGISKYAVEDAERGKILNNLAVHFADRGRPELALYHFREALAVLKLAGPERFELATRVFSNMSHVCRKAGFEEADEYDQMQHLVSP